MLKYVYKNVDIRRLFSTTVIKQEREMFVRDERIHVNLGTIGPTQHGKTSLVSVFTKVLNKTHGVPVKEIQDIDNGTMEKATGSSQNPTHIELWRDKYRYSVTDLPGSSAYYRNLYTHISLLDVCLLVINPEEGVLKEMVEVYKVAEHFGNIVMPVVSTRERTEPETIDLVRMELEELGLGENEAIVVDNPLSKDPYTTITSLFDSLERKIGRIKRNVEGSLYFPLEQVGSIPSRGTFCAGRLKSGKIKVGSPLEVFYNGQTSKATVKDLEIFRKKSENLIAGDRGGVFIKLKPEIDLKRGGVLFDPGAGQRVGSSWRVSLRSMSGELVTKGEYVLFHSTFSDGRSSLDPCRLVEHEPTETILRSTAPFMGSTGDPIFIKKSNTAITGYLVEPLD